MLELTKEVKQTPAPDPGAGAPPGEKKIPDAVPESPIDRVKVVRPGELAQIKPNLPPGPGAKKPKGKDRVSSDPGLDDLKVPLAKFVKVATEIIADRTGKKAWIAKDDEAQDIENAFDVWMRYRFPKLKGAIPELFLLMAVLGYLARVQAEINETPAPTPAQGSGNK